MGLQTCGWSGKSPKTGSLPEKLVQREIVPQPVTCRRLTSLLIQEKG